MVGQRLGRWRCEVGHSEAGAAVRRGHLPWVAAARSSLWPRPHGCSDAGNGCRFRLPGFPLGWGRAHPRETGGGGGRGGRLGPWLSVVHEFVPKAAFSPTRFSLTLRSLLVSEGVAPAMRGGRLSQAEFSKSFLVVARDVVGRGTNFWGLVACPVHILERKNTELAF